MTVAAAIAATLALSGCVESKMPLMTDAKPLLGQQFEVHL
jgi:outer membrane murein-binding lipoprotein Lpp